MNRWNQLKNEYQNSGSEYQNVQTLKSEIDRLNEICRSAKKDSNRIHKDQLIRHQQVLENALADLELSTSGKSSTSYPDINGNQYYSGESKPNSSMTMGMAMISPQMPKTAQAMGMGTGMNTSAWRVPSAASQYQQNLQHQQQNLLHQQHPQYQQYHPQQQQQQQYQQQYPYQDNSLYANVPMKPVSVAATTTIGGGLGVVGKNHGNQVQSTVNGTKARNSSQSVQLLHNNNHPTTTTNNNNQYSPPNTIDSNIYANIPTSGGQSSVLNHSSTNIDKFRNRSKAEQVDHLTDLLVKSMESSNEPDFFGMCNKCGEKVVGEGSGCTAMEMVYHIQCFTCTDCQKELRGKSFYALENNPFCEDCYLNTLEKCCVCEKPILDRILRATGKPYHPSCFTCVICRKSLDGIPFTVDATNQVHCIDCFHEKFAPRCSVCKEPIIPEAGKTETVRVVALDRSFHVACYKCEDCDLLLSSDAEGRGCYPLDDHILCRNCNAKRVQAITA